ncbi:MAG: flagellin [Nitrospinota bacterium]|nr:flagellin [Nitrospinota bacterium]
MPLSDLAQAGNSAQSGLVKINRSLSENFNKLSSGRRINKAADDAAGLSVAEMMSSRVRGLDQAVRNVSEGSAMLRTAEGGLSQISDMLIRGKELAVQASNGTLSPQQRETINNEFSQIMQEIDRTAGNTEFNGQKLLTGEMGTGAVQQMAIQAGADGGESNRIGVATVEPATTQSMGLSGANLDNPQNARVAMNALDSAIGQVSQSRANIGALGNRLDSTISNLAVNRENLAAAEGQIRGLDYAEETSSLARNEALFGAGIKTLQEVLKSQQTLIGSLLNTAA